MITFHAHNRYCHAERSEASVGPSRQTLRFAQGDKSFPILLVKTHHHAPTDASQPPPLLSFLLRSSSELRRYLQQLFLFPPCENSSVLTMLSQLPHTRLDSREAEFVM